MSPPLDTAPAVQPQDAGVQAVGIELKDIQSPALLLREETFVSLAELKVLASGRKATAA